MTAVHAAEAAHSHRDNHRHNHREGRRTRRRLLACLPLCLALLSACSGLQLINDVTPATGYTLQAGVPYGPLPRQRLDIYRPTAPLPQGQTDWPVVVFFYGGSWREGDRGEYRFVAQALADKGAVVVVPDYRLYPAVQWRGILDDCAAAVAWTLQHATDYAGDPRRVLVAGHSAGAYNAAMVALDPDLLAKYGSKPAALAGFIGLAGPYDFVPIQDTDVLPVFGGPRPPPESQPMFYAQAGHAPARTLLIAADDDHLVDPQRNTVGLAAALRQDGAPVEAHLFPRLSHATTVGAFALPLRGLAPVLDDVARFVRDTPAVGSVQAAATNPINETRSQAAR
jgi:acetyl esterase/lipase